MIWWIWDSRKKNLKWLWFPQKNVSVELALDAIFANRASQTASKESTQVHIDPQVSESDIKDQIDVNSKEESKEELKEELKEDKKIEIHRN